MLRSRSAAIAAGATLATVAVLTIAVLQARAKRQAREAEISARADERERAEHERERRRRDACERTRRRIGQGATVGPSEVEGWVVEVALLRREGAPGPSETDAVRAAERTFSGANARTGELRVGGGYVGFVCTAAEPLVSAYFSPDNRGRVQRFAEELAASYQASHAALYARCEDGETHHMGAWFSGATLGSALAALTVFMGTYADAPHVGPEWLVPDRARTLEALHKAASNLQRRGAAELLAPHGGSVAGERGDRTVLVFPFDDANRASRASLAVARALGVGVK